MIFNISSKWPFSRNSLERLPMIILVYTLPSQPAYGSAPIILKNNTWENNIH